MLYKIPKLYNGGSHGLRSPFFCTFFSLKQALGWHQKILIMFFQRACMLNKIHKIDVKSSQTLDARASGHFLTPSWAWSWPWGWYLKIPIMFFQRSHWTQYPKFMFRSFKTVETRASRLNFQTLPWVCRWPWGRYQKIPIMHFLRVCVFTKIPIVQLQNCGSQGPRNPFSNTFLSPRLALRVVTESTNNVFSKG